jgi:hypothetical protein
MWCILITENSPDRLIEGVIGPFLTCGDAAEKADELYKSDDNIARGGLRKFNYNPWSLQAPGDYA